MKLAAVAVLLGQLLPKANKAITQALLDAGETVQIQLGVARYQNKTNQTKTTTIKRGINYVKSLFMCNFLNTLEIVLHSFSHTRT